MTASRIAIELRAVSKAYGSADCGPPVIDGLDLRVAAGDFVCLLGRSGSGKSTLLNLVAGLDRPSSGEVQVHGAGPAMLFQDHALFPWLNAGENVELALRLRGRAKVDRAAEVDRLLRLVRLEGMSGRRVHELSGGMRQRVALARALAQGSDILLMDEPFTALDATTRSLLHAELIRIWTDQRLTVLFVTHDVHEAVGLGSRVVQLSSHPGRVAREWSVGLSYPRRSEDPAVRTLTLDITARLQEEAGRHARP
ncbi:ABC transporter ATP-binding protein [Kitasatospora hibisci]|uniref:ABC transporter ATP-binding protein n=1 Tax=Kitasatospora hibisci TaxID=3369522 RepID=UPI003753F0FF